MKTIKVIIELFLTLLTKVKVYILISSGFIGIFFFVFSLMQNETIYNSTLGHITKNYTNVNGEISKSKVPYTTITNAKLLNWDGAHYKRIKDTGYRMKDKTYYFLYAFFPMFPALWSLLNVSEFTMCIVNYIMFCLSLIILFSLYKSQFETQKERLYRFILLFCSPLLVVFIMPYTEATFFLASAVAIYGFMKNKYWLYFLGLMMAAMTRSTIVILLLSFTFSYILLILKHKGIVPLFKHYILAILPAIIGLFSVVFIHHLYGSEKLFIFIDALQTWDNRFRIPTQFSDWSHESFAITIVIICFIPLALTYLAKAIFKSTKRLPALNVSIIQSELFKKNLIFNISIIYCLGVFFSILLFKGGVLNGIPRYIVCSPFFYIILFGVSDYVKNKSPQTVFYLLGTLSLIGFILLTKLPYSAQWNFSDFGFFITLGLIWLTVFFNRIKFPTLRVAILALLFLSILWNTFLFNSFLSNAWIFT